MAITVTAGEKLQTVEVLHFLKKPPTQKEQISQKVRIRNSARDETISDATFKP